MRGIDGVMRQMLGEEQYLTACYARLNQRTRALSVVSAGHPPVLVVEATGSPTGLALAQQIIEPRGTLVLKSTFHGAAPVETWPIVVKEITIVGSRCGPFAKAITLLRSGEIDPTPLITRIFPLSHAPTALRFAQERGVMKVLLKPESEKE